ncbi:MAG: right-handed parallel beta-helix repeat-containing protein [Planctomycetes bacterium]|nr:right-handed parallel beta-helix repeat-containing protein [Planctomycetota bacterium]
MTRQRLTRFVIVPCATAVLLLLAAAGRAATITVSQAGAISTIGAGVAAAGPGDTVVVKSGLYQENVVIPAGKDGLKLLAKGNVIIEARPAGGAGAGNGIQVGSANVSISKFTVQNAKPVVAPPPFGYGIYSTAAGLTVKDCTIINCESGGLRATSGDGTTILNCKLLGTDGGIYVAGNGVTVSKVTILNDDGGTIQIVGNDAKVTKCAVYVSEDDGITITGNDALIQNNKLYDLDGAGIDVTGAGARIEKNQVLGAYGDLIYVSGGTDCVIRENTLSTCDDNGIETSSCPGAKILDNKIEATNSYGIDHQGDNATIAGNELRKIDDEGIEALGNGLLIEKNMIDCTNGEGLWVNGSDFQVLKNTIRHCFDDSAGIYVSSAATVGLIQGNNISYCSDAGINLANASSTGVMIEGNTVTRTGESGDYAAIEVRGGAHTVRKNKVKEIGADGIRVNGNSILIEDNDVSACRVDGIDVQSGTGNTVEDNKVTGCAGEGIENSGTNSTVQGNFMKGSRRDLANDGTGTQTGNTFSSGGWAQTPEID